MSTWIECMQFSLRQVEYLLRALCVAWNATDPDRYIKADIHQHHEYTILFLMMLRIKDHDRYQQYKAGKIKAKELIEYCSQFVSISKPDMPVSDEQRFAYVSMERTIYGLTRAQDERAHIENALNSLKNEDSAVDSITDEERKEMKRYLASTTIECSRLGFVNADGIEVRYMQVNAIRRVMGDLDRDVDLDYPFELVDMFKREEEEKT